MLAPELKKLKEDLEAGKSICSKRKRGQGSIVVALLCLLFFLNLFSAVDCIDFAFDGDYNLIKYTRTH